jgi:hypothetical protein
MEEPEHPYAITKIPGTKPAMMRYNEALPGSVHTILSVGFSRSGKTTAAVQMYSNKKFPFKAQFGNGERIWLISPTHHVQTDVWDRLNIPLEFRFKHYDEKILQRYIQTAENDTNRPRLPRLLMLDDCISELPTRRQNNLIRILVYGRHLNCSCWCGIQKWSCSLSHISKSNFTNFHLFPQNRHEEESIYRQVCGDITRDMCSASSVGTPGRRPTLS